MTKTHGYLGIDAGTQGLSVIFTDEEMRIRATGSGSYEMVPGLAAGCYEQRPGDWEAALVAAMADLRANLAALGVEMDVRGIGISGQMHGEVLADAAGQPLGPARLWCDGRNEAEGHELTERLGVKMPKRITAARWLWTIRNRPELAAQVARITTPAGWLAHLLTGDWTLGIGDAAGMFPIDQESLDYDARLLADFDALVAAQHGGPRVRPLRDLLPAVRRAGQDGGTLDARGATLLGLPQGIPVAPAEGDQPAALAGALIGDAGQVAMSFGTSVVANAVGDRPFQGIARAIDHFCAPDGKPINMVWLRNGTTAMNTVVEMFGRALPGAGDPGAAFAAVMPQVLAAPDDCGGIAALPFLDDEPGIGVSRGGTAALIGLDGTNATPGNVAKAMLLATIFNLRMGSDLLDTQGFPRTEIILSGGLTKTPGLGQILADAFHTPVVLLDGATEGTAWGAALMAKFRTEALAGKAAAWPAFLQRHATGTPTRFTPRPKAAAALDRAFARHQRLVAIHGPLDAAVHG
jgi:sugar (pentulose or hexulose) kinase